MRGGNSFQARGMPPPGSGGCATVGGTRGQATANFQISHYYTKLVPGFPKKKYLQSQILVPLLSMISIHHHRSVVTSNFTHTPMLSSSPLQKNQP